MTTLQSNRLASLILFSNSLSFFTTVELWDKEEALPEEEHSGDTSVSDSFKKTTVIRTHTATKASMSTHCDMKFLPDVRGSSPVKRHCHLNKPIPQCAGTRLEQSKVSPTNTQGVEGGTKSKASGSVPTHFTTESAERRSLSGTKHEPNRTSAEEGLTEDSLLEADSHTWISNCSSFKYLHTHTHICNHFHIGMHSPLGGTGVLSCLNDAVMKVQIAAGGHAHTDHMNSSLLVTCPEDWWPNS